MKQEIRVPEVAEGVTKGTVVAIAVSVGDRVASDQTLLELETDKAVVEIPSPTAGRIDEIRVAEGAEVDVGAVMVILDCNEDSAESEKASTAAAESTTGAPEPEPKAEAEPEAEEPAVPKTAKSAAGVPPAEDTEPAPAKDEIDLTSVRRDDEVAPASPTVRRQARELGVDIYRVRGSGPGGRISAEDIRTYVRDTMQKIGSGMAVPSATAQPAQRPLPDLSRFGEISREPLSRVRELTADAMGYAWSTIPMVTQYDKARIDDIEKFRKEFNTSAPAEDKLTMTAFLVKGCAAALRAFPHFNSALDLASKELVLNHFINIGVAVDTPAGLLVPVIRDADSKGVARIATELNKLAEKTRERRVSPQELEGGTFTISNLGGIGGSAFTPIVYPPQVAILGVSKAEMAPVWNGKKFAPQLMLPLSLTYDHRVIDGAAGARFLRWICEALETPLNLVMKG
ncbi:MAG: 2-oxo acid dehydrogenase subunit E2 [Desulfuromonadales bacterium]|nr:2-oxo acid dehydrogenase subunit E2 [Desulfuromonadales bacterium]